MPLRVSALLFGEARDLAGTKAMVLDLPKDACKVPDFLRALHDVAGAKLSEKVLVAGKASGVVLAPGYMLMINKRIMGPREAEGIVLREADEVGILPPFSGG